jgi:hypothetical protein
MAGIMKSMLVGVGFVITMMVFSACQADQIILSGEQLAQLRKLPDLERRRTLAGDDIRELRSGLESDFDQIRVAAIKVALLQRQSLATSWPITSARPMKGTSAKLWPLTDAVFAAGVDRKQPLLRILPRESLDSLPRAGEPQKPKPREGDAPVEDVLMDIVVADSANSIASGNDSGILRQLSTFRLTPEQQARLKSASGK